MFIGPVFGPLLKILGADEAAIRASLCASQLVGLGIMRYGVHSEPLHSMSVDARRRHRPDDAALPGR
jgi:Tetracyclin repressor-like, C-terminal domain